MPQAIFIFDPMSISTGGRLGSTSLIFVTVMALYTLTVLLTTSVSLEHQYDGPEGCSNTIPRLQHSKQITPTPEFFNSSVRFIFFIGLEGTGHHLLKGIVSQAPAVDRLRQLEIHYDLTIPLQEALHHEKRKDGLFNAHCQTNHDRINTTATQERVVSILQQIEGRAKTIPAGILPVGEKPRHADDIGYTHPAPFTTIPINTLQASSSSGEMSYPNYHGDCRKLNFPNMDLWYASCRKAQVDCHHIYLWRDPYAILKSTTVNRDHNSNHKLGAIHLYTSLQTVIQAQLATHHDKTLGCMGMLDAKDENWWETMRLVFGWKNTTSFYKNTKLQFYKPRRRPMTFAEQQELVPPELQVYMDSWERIHEQTNALCQQQVQQNRQWIQQLYGP
jgi:hypothetical protein